MCVYNTEFNSLLNSYRFGCAVTDVQRIILQIYVEKYENHVFTLDRRRIQINSFPVIHFISNLRKSPWLRRLY